MARAFDQPAALGLFMGSVAYLGGHGTATAWSSAPEGLAVAGAFGLGAMPVGLSVLRRLNASVGATPRALLAITLAASLYQDTANALILAALFRWFGGGA